MNIAVRLFYLKADVGKFVANAVSGLVRNKEKRHKLRDRLNPLNPERCVRYLSDHYARAVPSETPSAHEERETIWMCWLQGEAKAPRLVLNCIESVRRLADSSQRVVVLTEHNFSQYVELPAVFVSKWRGGLISNTHFSDLLRIHALAQHGGYWIDATCLQTSAVPSFIRESSLFMFRSHGEFSYTLIQSCFIRCERDNYVMRKWCAAMEAYWQREDRLIQYFALHLMFIALVRSDEAFAAQYRAMPVVSDEPMHILLEKIVSGAHYDEATMDRARKAAFFQKLTYKFPPRLLDDGRSFASVLSGKDLFTASLTPCLCP